MDNKFALSLTGWYKSGTPWVWINAGAVSISAIAVIGLLLILALRGFGHFWPSDIMQADYAIPGENRSVPIAGEIIETLQVPVEQLKSAGITFSEEPDSTFLTRHLIKAGNRDLTGRDFRWVIAEYLSNIDYPAELVAIERAEWGNFYGRITGVQQQDTLVWSADNGPFDASTNSYFQKSFARSQTIKDNIESIQKSDINTINHGLERLRLKQRRIELDLGRKLEEGEPELVALNAERKAYNQRYEVIQKKLTELYQAVQRDSLIALSIEGREVSIPMAKVVQLYQPNSMSLADKSLAYIHNFYAFISEDPREANTEGGIFPAIFGTVMMVILMSILVTPFGVVAAVYLHEYARQGVITRFVRVSVNNLAGVPSIVYGVFGLGFFVYLLGGSIDQLFFPEALPAPTFGTPGLLWASLTLAILTLPVVIVATEEGLARIPRSVREGSLALGATKAETLWRVILPVASPAMMTGLILAVARAAGEVAPLMLVGVVKLAPSLPVNAQYPFIHLDQKFMHLGFHIYDVGFQSPNVEAARPLVYATSFLLVVLIALLNFSAVTIRNHLREKYKALEN